MEELFTSARMERIFSFGMKKNLYRRVLPGIKGSFTYRSSFFSAARGIIFLVYSFGKVLSQRYFFHLKII